MEQRTVEDRHAQGADGFVFEDPLAGHRAAEATEAQAARALAAKAA